MCLDTAFNMDVISAGSMRLRDSDDRACAQRSPADASASVGVLAFLADLHIDIDLLNIHKDWSFEDHVGSWTGIPIKEKCINLHLPTA